MNRQDIRNEGFRHGWNVASWTDLPEIGQRLSPDVDWVGYGTVTEANLGDVWEMLAFLERYNISLDQMRKFNALVKPYSVYEVFDAGFEAGIRAYWRKHYAPKRRA